MKEESRKILDYLISKHSLRIGHYDGYSEQDEAWNLQEEKICDFLESIPEIESHLCRGGYIQDKNGTPCCDGDKVKRNGNEYRLYWSIKECRFYFIDQNKVKIMFNHEFEKVTE